MALLALAADKGSPGVTTAALALAAVWPRSVLLAEADPAGGDLLYRSTRTGGGPPDPGVGVLSLAAGARRGLSPGQLWQHTQQLNGGLDVLLGLESAEQSLGLSELWNQLGASFGTLSEPPRPPGADEQRPAVSSVVDVLADCGRLTGEGPALELLPHAALVLLVARAEPECLARVRDRAAALTARLHPGGYGSGPRLGVLLVCDPGRAARTARQVEGMLNAARTGAHVLGTLALDPAGAAQLVGRRRGRPDRSLLIRTARRTAADLQRQLEPYRLPEHRPPTPGERLEPQPQVQQSPSQQQQQPRAKFGRYDGAGPNCGTGLRQQPQPPAHLGQAPDSAGAGR